MSSPTLLRLIDESILPSIILLVAKFIGLVFIGAYLQLSIVGIFSKSVVLTTEQYLTLNSYASFIMVMVYFLAFAFILLRGFKLHESHISPKAMLLMVSQGLLEMVVSSLKLFHQYIIWGLFSLLTAATLWVYAYNGLIFSWVAGTAVLGSVIFQWLIVLDIEHELRLSEIDSGHHLEILE